MTAPQVAALWAALLIIFTIGCWLGALLVRLHLYIQNDRPRIRRTLEEKTPVRKEHNR